MTLAEKINNDLKEAINYFKKIKEVNRIVGKNKR